MVLPADVDALSYAELKALVIVLVGKVTELERTVAAQRDEIARLKGLKGRPQIKPSGMDQATTPPEPRKSARLRRRQRAKRAELTVHEERVIPVGPLPPGARFKGYANFLVQDLVLQAKVVRLRRERWLTADGQTVTAPMPADVTGHFGPGLRRFVLAQYHQGQVTIPRLLDQLASFGLVISKRQLVRLLIAGQDHFCAEARAVLRAGLEPPGSASTTPAPATGPGTKCAPRSATIISPGSAPPPRRAG
jgi:hypothetical protein